MRIVCWPIRPRVVAAPRPRVRHAVGYRPRRRRLGILPVTASGSVACAVVGTTVWLTAAPPLGGPASVPNGPIVQAIDLGPGPGSYAGGLQGTAPVQIPEPTSLALLALGAGVVALLRRSR